MTALRITRSLPPRVLAPAALVALVAACGGPQTVINGDRPTTARLPLPAVERMDYDANTRTLTLYRLPASGRWLVSTPERPEGVAVGPAHVLADGADPDETYVAYRRPSGQSSGWVTLSDVIAARATHASNVR